MSDEYNDWLAWTGYGVGYQPPDVEINVEPKKKKREDYPCTCTVAQMWSGMFANDCPYHNYKEEECQK